MTVDLATLRAAKFSPRDRAFVLGALASIANAAKTDQNAARWLTTRAGAVPERRR